MTCLWNKSSLIKTLWKQLRNSFLTVEELNWLNYQKSLMITFSVSFFTGQVIIVFRLMNTDEKWIYIFIFLKFINVIALTQTAKMSKSLAPTQNKKSEESPGNEVGNIHKAVFKNTPAKSVRSKPYTFFLLKRLNFPWGWGCSYFSKQ